MFVSAVLPPYVVTTVDNVQRVLAGSVFTYQIDAPISPPSTGNLPSS